MIRRAFLPFFLAVLFFSAAGNVHAQIPTAGDISISVSPTNPGPLEDVTISIQSYSVNIPAADIEWSVDGKSEVGGIGQSNHTITTKNIGSPTTVRVTITGVGSVPVTRSIVITPMAVDILWQAIDSVVPPLYRGKALPTSESQVKFVAIPQIKSQNGTLLSSQNFLYSWSEKYTVQQSRSGYGKDSFTTNMDYLNPIKHIGIDVSVRDGSIATKSSLDLSPVQPKILWYASSPLYGPQFDRALGDSYIVSGSETSIVAEPYFFSPADPSDKAISYVWSLNGQPLSTPAIPNALFLHRESKATGKATLDLSVTNLARLFQEGKAHLNLSLQ